MKTHPYVRAYMAGIALPTMFLLLVIAFFGFYRPTHYLPMNVERLMIFPMAVVPNLWGLWNILYVFLQRKRSFSIGWFGAALPVVITPIGYAVQRGLEIIIWTPEVFVIGLPVALIVYYLAWKYGVTFFNEVVGVA